VDDLDLDELLLQLEVLLHFEVYLLLVSSLELLSAINVRVVQMGQLDAVFAAELLYLASEPIYAIVHIIYDTIFLEL
jgi:hypothetical protein